MRIITGTARGIQLDTLDGLTTRPTSDRVKEALFSMIQFDIEGRNVLDLFGGSGQLALEALSRGAVKATIIDSSRDAIDIIIGNAKKTRLFDKCRISCSDYSSFAEHASSGEKYGIIFLDPPYASDYMARSLALIAKNGLLADGGTVVCESEVPEEERTGKKKRRESKEESEIKANAEINEKLFGNDTELSAKYTLIKSSVYGRTRITLLTVHRD